MEQLVQEIASVTETERAKQDFLQQARQIAGISVETGGGNTLAEQPIRVIVPSILGTIADQVSALEVRIRRQYRYARLNVEFEVAETCSDDCMPAEATVNE